jgi:hypothetical protein
MYGRVDEQQGRREGERRELHKRCMQAAVGYPALAYYDICHSRQGKTVHKRQQQGECSAGTPTHLEEHGSNAAGS